MKKLKLNIQMFSSTNKTTNYDLPQFVGTDKPTWLGDVNQAMADIDAGMHANATAISTMASDVATARATASQASQDVSALTSTVNTLSGNVQTATTTANNAQQTATSALNTANTANGKADTNASNIATNTSNIGNLSNLTTTDKTSLVNAINEIESQELGITGHILWTNPDPTQTFNSQNITLNSSDYDILEVYNAQATSNTRLQNSRIIKGYDGIIYTIFDTGSSARRTLTRISDTSYTVGTVQGETEYSGNNNFIIPLYVIGYKTGLFS